MEQDHEELAELEKLETGKTMEESLTNMEAIRGVFRYFGGV